MKLVRLWLRLACASALLSASGSAQVTTRVSVDSSGAQGTGDSSGPAMTPDGRYVAFDSYASNLVPADTNNDCDVFVHDNQTGLTILVSVDSNGIQGNGGSFVPSISADGRFVAFYSEATSLVPADTNGQMDIFVHDLQTGQTTRVSVDSNGVQGNGISYLTAISGDGRYVAFLSYANNLVPGDTNGVGDVFVHDSLTGQTTRVSVDSSGLEGNNVSFVPAISADGRYVAFVSQASNLVAGDTNNALDVFVRDLQVGQTTRLSVDSSGMEGNGSSGDNRISMSSDGRYVVFGSVASNLIAGDTNGSADVFAHDCQTGQTTRVGVDSGGGEGNGNSSAPSISVDGRYVSFQSDATNLVPGDTNGHADVFLHDIQAGTTTLASRSTSGSEGDGDSAWPSVSGDGQRVVFYSAAANLVVGDTNGSFDVFLREDPCSGSISTYCTAKTNSLGCVPSIGSIGLPSQSGPDNFYVTASNVRNNKLGMMLWSLSQDSHPFFGGTLCLHAPIKRTLGQNSGGNAAGSDCTGSYAYHFTQAYMLQQLLGANTTVYAQFWSRDPGFAPPNSIGLTNGLSFTICP